MAKDPVEFRFPMHIFYFIRVYFLAVTFCVNAVILLQCIYYRYKHVLLVAFIQNLIFSYVR
jgi:hypothetical protein